MVGPRLAAQGGPGPLPGYFHSSPSGRWAAAQMTSSQSSQISKWTSSMLLEASTTCPHRGQETGRLMLLTVLGVWGDTAQVPWGPSPRAFPDPRPRPGRVGSACVLGPQLPAPEAAQSCSSASCSDLTHDPAGPAST